eukprot:CAMPEP_0167754190 /NCGR_PEP_ID=MMETSP0110_2-20121227/8130_1 /TAXON_ID=629695 /ORGANISM="Gymnochlora sp., Strain CCMP2014" /LENGTH=439 /DNA_ID=CAMNT_0007640037 /DNA_START=270 /DNA_END=1589 /DNA_ORIENTATION=-
MEPTESNDISGSESSADKKSFQWRRDYQENILDADADREETKLKHKVAANDDEELDFEDLMEKRELLEFIVKNTNATLHENIEELEHMQPGTKHRVAMEYSIRDLADRYARVKKDLNRTQTLLIECDPLGTLRDLPELRRKFRRKAIGSDGEKGDEKNRLEVEGRGEIPSLEEILHGSKSDRYSELGSRRKSIERYERLDREKLENMLVLDTEASLIEMRRKSNSASNSSESNRTGHLEEILIETANTGSRPTGGLFIPGREGSEGKFVSKDDIEKMKPGDGRRLARREIEKSSIFNRRFKIDPDRQLEVEAELQKELAEFQPMYTNPDEGTKLEDDEEEAEYKRIRNEQVYQPHLPAPAYVKHGTQGSLLRSLGIKSIKELVGIKVQPSYEIPRSMHRELFERCNAVAPTKHGLPYQDIFDDHLRKKLANLDDPDAAV